MEKTLNFLQVAPRPQGQTVGLLAPSVEQASERASRESRALACSPARPTIEVDDDGDS